MALDNNLFRMKDAHKRLQQKEDITHPVTDEEMKLGEHDRTLTDILDNDRTQDLFLNKFCYEQDSAMAKDIVESLASDTVLTAKQTTFLEKMREDFNMRTAEVEKLQEILPNMIGRIAENDPRIKEVVGKIGPEKAAELLGAEFILLAMSNTKQFRKTVKELRDLHDLETNPLTAHLERSVQESLRKYGISEEQYWEATQGGQNAATKDSLDTLAREQMGFFSKAIDSATGYVTGRSISNRRGAEMYQNYVDQSNVIEAADKHMKALGRILQGTLNKDVNLAIQRAMLTNTEVDENRSKDNLTTITQYNAIKEEVATIQPRWEKFRDSEAQRLSIKNLSSQPAALESMKDRFAAQEFQKQNEYRPSGVFIALLAFLFGTRSKDDIKSSLK